MTTLEERDEARTAARELLKRLLLLAPEGTGYARTLSARAFWEAKYPWLKLEKWP